MSPDPPDLRLLPLCVDLDGTLVEDDTLHFSARALLRASPTAVAGMAAALLGGRAGVKDFIASRFVPAPEALRWRAEVVAFVRAQHAEGREIILVTAAHRRIAEMVAAHLPVFARVLATEAGRNLKGEEKVRALRNAGVADFDFITDSLADLPALRMARRVWLVAPSAALEQAEGVRERIAGVFCRA
jgi:phosphoserine phosphatase